MTAKDHRPRPSIPTGAFSLIEVVIAISLVAFALVAIFGVMGSVVGQFADVRTKRAISGAIGSLSEYLNDPENLDAVLSWAGGDGATLFIVTYRVDANGVPRVDGVSTRTECRPAAEWMGDSSLDAYESARQGPWVGASVRLDNNLTAMEAVPASAAQFVNGCLVLQARLFMAHAPTTVAAAQGISSATVVPIVVAR